MDSAVLEDLREAIALRQEDALVMAEVAFGELTVTVAPSAIPAFVAWLKADPNCRFTTPPSFRRRAGCIPHPPTGS